MISFAVIDTSCPDSLLRFRPQGNLLEKFKKNIASALIWSAGVILIFDPQKLPDISGISYKNNVAQLTFEGDVKWVIKREPYIESHLYFQIFREAIDRKAIELYAAGGVYILDLETGLARFSHYEK